MSQLQTVFITGATGFIGGSVLAELINNHKEEYSITALVRSETKAQAVSAFGAKPLIGSHGDPGLLEQAARTHDVWLFCHWQPPCIFNHVQFVDD